MRADVFRAVGEFGGIDIAEDTEWGKRASRLGYCIRYEPDMVVYHPARKNFAELTAKWDRHIAHDFVQARSEPLWWPRWVARSVAIALSPAAEFRRILASDRLTGARARALAIYSLGIPIGLAGGVLLGAYIAALVEWRAAFITMGIAGIVLAPIFIAVVRDLPRPPKPAETQPVPLGAVFPMLARKPSFWLMAFAAGCSSLTGYGLALWTPAVLMRSFGFDLITTGQFMGSLLLVGGTAGVFAGGWLADRLGCPPRPGCCS